MITPFITSLEMMIIIIVMMVVVLSRLASCLMLGYESGACIHGTRAKNEMPPAPFSGGERCPREG